mmetsp:Transcript_2049/g.3818  ORF Transcript_2049/g.3818 Transcript_2049/m.3818 type:complete len:274 (+) Transcript_2049:263-1084(+)
MKCGSTFGATLAHFANSSLPKGAHMPSCNHLDASEEDACPGGNQGPYEFFLHKYPEATWFHQVFWTKSGDPDPGNHRRIDDSDWSRFEGSFVGMFRQPESRMVSAFNHMANGEGDILRFAKYTRGTVTKMLSGYHGPQCSFEYTPLYLKSDECSTVNCYKCVVSAETELPAALRRLQTGFAFVGITEYFSLSICLFHAMFGGQCLPAEFANMRKGVEKIDPAVLMEELKGNEDVYDGAVYDEATRIFWSNIQKYNVSTERCAQLCPDVDTFKR